MPASPCVQGKNAVMAKNNHSLCVPSSARCGDIQIFSWQGLAMCHGYRQLLPALVDKNNTQIHKILPRGKVTYRLLCISRSKCGKLKNEGVLFLNKMSFNLPCPPRLQRQHSRLHALCFMKTFFYGIRSFQAERSLRAAAFLFPRLALPFHSRKPCGLIF